MINKPVIPCSDCGILYCPLETQTKICPTCICKKHDISEGITRTGTINWCRYCKKYSGETWVYCELESKELLSICLKKIRGLNKVTLINADFIWTEPHSRRIRVKLKIQKEISFEIKLEQEFEVEFVVNYTQCDECKKLFTPHTWVCCVQVRQKVKHKRTFLFLEQLMLKHKAHENCIKIEKAVNGMNFYFSSKSHGNRLVDFLQSLIPSKIKESKELVTHDEQNGVYTYKYTILFEMPKICKDDLIIMPKQLCKEFGGVNALALCYKVSNRIHLIDITTLRIFEMNTQQYYNFESEINIIQPQGITCKFQIIDIEQNESFAKSLHHSMTGIETKFAHVEAVREDEIGGRVFCSITHLGHILKYGDCVLGYDLNAVESLIDLETEMKAKGQKNTLPDFIIIKKVYATEKTKNRIWKLNRMKIEEGEIVEKKKNNKNYDAIDEDKEYQDFLDDLEQNKKLREKINLVKNEDVINNPNLNISNNSDKEMVKLNELMDDLCVENNEDNILNNINKNFDNLDF